MRHPIGSKYAEAQHSYSVKAAGSAPPVKERDLTHDDVGQQDVTLEVVSSVLKWLPSNDQDGA
jgi:hypothetical protein